MKIAIAADHAGFEVELPVDVDLYLSLLSEKKAEESAKQGRTPSPRNF